MKTKKILALFMLLALSPLSLLSHGGFGGGVGGGLFGGLIAGSLVSAMNNKQQPQVIVIQQPSNDGTSEIITSQASSYDESPIKKEV